MRWLSATRCKRLQLNLPVRRTARRSILTTECRAFSSGKGSLKSDFVLFAICVKLGLMIHSNVSGVYWNSVA